MTTPLALLDRDTLTAMTGGDDSLAIEVIDIFQEQAGIWSRLMDPKAEPRQWADAAHTLKGSSLSIGALRLAQACERAEKAGRAETPPSITAAAVLLGDVRDILALTLEEAMKTSYQLAGKVARNAS
ncbi:MAG: Hpt domain-containing protein [Hyphomonas sp.]|uniref:Hpt domain-containing protein n=1 Tax=Hyphomonas sp. TaxID=87 RepID=UPI003527A6FE